MNDPLGEAHTLTSYQAEFPAEPPVFSVLLDIDGIAWQASFPHNLENGELVWRSTSGMVVKSWGHLLVDRGPLTLIWEGVPDVP